MAKWDHDDLRNRSNDCQHGVSYGHYYCDQCNIGVTLLSDIQSPNAMIESGDYSPVTFGEFWHLSPEGDGFAGPFATKEAAVADARKYLQDEGGRYDLDEICIVKTVARGKNTVTVETNFHDV